MPGEAATLNERHALHSKLSRRARLRALALAIPVAALTVLAAGTGAAGAVETLPATTAVIKIEETKGKLKFVAPESVTKGEQLEVVNETNPKQVGPHTFSLATKGSLPKTPKARQSCFTPKHICMAIARWHGVKGNGPVKVNPVDAGAEGWDTLGSGTKTGDSWFTGSKPGTSIVEKVTAAADTTLYFICAIHPWMQGSTKVLPAPVVPTS